MSNVKCRTAMPWRLIQKPWYNVHMPLSLASSFLLLGLMPKISFGVPALALNSVLAASILFADLDLATDGRSIVEKGTLDVFVTNSKDIKTCLAMQVDLYPGVKICVLRARDTHGDCLFCGESIPPKLMMGHVTNHMLDGNKVCDSKHSGDHPVCGFCGATNRICTVQLKGRKVSSTCPYAYASAVKRGANVPRQCPMHVHNYTLHLGNTTTHFHGTSWANVSVPEVRPAPSICVHVPKSGVTTSSDQGGDIFGQKKATGSLSDWHPHHEEQVAANSESNGEQEEEAEESNSQSGSKNNTGTSKAPVLLRFLVVISIFFFFVIKFRWLFGARNKRYSKTAPAKQKTTATQQSRRQQPMKGMHKQSATQPTPNSRENKRAKS